MEFTKTEMNALEVAVEETKVDAASELKALELVLAGGGNGTVVW